MTTEDLDPAFLAWSMHLRMGVDRMPDSRVVMEFQLLSEVTKKIEYFWLVKDNGTVDMCMKHPGYESDLVVVADLRTFIEAWRGFRNLKDEIHNGSIVVDGPKPYREAFPEWLMLSMFAPYGRQNRGRELDLYQKAQVAAAESPAEETLSS